MYMYSVSHRLLWEVQVIENGREVCFKRNGKYYVLGVQAQHRKVTQILENLVQLYCLV